MKLRTIKTPLKLNTIFFLAFAVSPMVASSLVARDPIYPANDSFELPDLGTDPATSFKYWNELSKEQLGAAAWTFTGSAGIAANGSFFNTVGAANGNHDGTKSAAGQVAFMTGTSSVSQSVGGLPVGKIVITFSLEARSTDSKKNPVQLLIDDAPVETYTPETTDKFTEIKATATVTAGAHTIGFKGTVAESEPTTFVDKISVETASETPASTPKKK